MDIATVVWNFIMAHWKDAMTAIAGIKPIADSIESVKQLMPAKLESKAAAQAYIEQTADTLNDPEKTIEEKRWEVETRTELARSMVQLTALDVAYHIAQTVILSLFFRMLLHWWARITLFRQEEERKR